MNETEPLLAFDHLPKTAGQTIRKLLRNYFGPHLCDLQVSPFNFTHPDWTLVKKLYPNLRCASGHACATWGPVGEVESARFFTFVRLPVSRVISNYQYRLAGGKYLEEFPVWASKNSNSQVRRLAGKEDLDAAKAVLAKRMGFVGLTERFNESVLMWHRWLNLPNFDIRYERVNVSTNIEVRHHIEQNAEWMEIVRNKNLLDQRLYDYVKDEIFPAQQKLYGPDFEADLKAYENSLQGFRNRTSFYGFAGALKRELFVRPILKRKIGRKQKIGSTKII